jgi:hypothetical protein
MDRMSEVIKVLNFQTNNIVEGSRGCPPPLNFGCHRPEKKNSLVFYPTSSRVTGMLIPLFVCKHDTYVGRGNEAINGYKTVTDLYGMAFINLLQGNTGL